MSCRRHRRHYHHHGRGRVRGRGGRIDEGTNEQVEIYIELKQQSQFNLRSDIQISQLRLSQLMLR